MKEGVRARGVLLNRIGRNILTFHHLYWYLSAIKVVGKGLTSTAGLTLEPVKMTWDGFWTRSSSWFSWYWDIPLSIRRWDSFFKVRRESVQTRENHNGGIAQLRSDFDIVAHARWGMDTGYEYSPRIPMGAHPEMRFFFRSKHAKEIAQEYVWYSEDYFLSMSQILSKKAISG